MKKMLCGSALLWLAAVSRGVGQTNASTLPVLTLEQAHELALRNHPQIAAANYRALAAQQAVKEARSGFLPTATLYGSAVGADSHDTRLMAGGLNNPSVFDRAAQGIGLSQLITDFGRAANLTASSKYRAAAENQNAAATREQVLLQVDANYFGVLEAQAVSNVARQTLDTRQLLVDQVSLLASNKLKSDLDVSFARVALEQGDCCWKRPETIPTPRWLRLQRRWANGNFIGFSSLRNRSPRRLTPRMCPV
jgi:outer membrane protein